MRIPVLASCLLLTAAAYGQHRAGSAPRSYGYTQAGLGSGWGNVVFPGGAPGHAHPGNITDTSFGSRLGATVRGVPPGAVGYPGGARRGVPARTIVVPYPVIASYPYGYGYGYDQPQPEPVIVQAPQQQQPPVVIINQNYKPDTVNPQLSDYSNVELPPAVEQQDRQTLRVYENKPRQVVEEAKPTIYLIAMKEGSIMPALAFWVEGDTLNYITRESSHNRISLDRVDREFSVKLNQERGLEFRIP